MTTHQSWKNEFLAISKEWEAENKDRIQNMTREDIAGVADELQADAYEAAGGNRLELSEWAHYDASCADRADFEQVMLTK